MLIFSTSQVIHRYMQFLSAFQESGIWFPSFFYHLCQKEGVVVVCQRSCLYCYRLFCRCSRWPVRMQKLEELWRGGDQCLGTNETHSNVTAALNILFSFHIIPKFLLTFITFWHRTTALGGTTFSRLFLCLSQLPLQSFVSDKMVPDTNSGGFFALVFRFVFLELRRLMKPGSQETSISSCSQSFLYGAGETKLSARSRWST